MSYINPTIPANGSVVINEAGSFVRVLTSTGPINVKVYRNGSLLSDVADVGAGFWRKGQDFDTVKIEDASGASNTVEVMIDTAEVGYDRTAGVVQISGAVMVEAHSTTNAPFNLPNLVAGTATTVLGPNANRRGMIVQNNDATAVLWMRLDGNAAAIGQGIKILPGEYWESPPTWASSAEINVIATANTSSILFYDLN